MNKYNLLLKNNKKLAELAFELLISYKESKYNYFINDYMENEYGTRESMIKLLNQKCDIYEREINELSTEMVHNKKMN